MKIGILTFHWAANYGAVLQCYALQTFLQGLGHEVEVINYKPRYYDDTVVSFIRKKKFLHLREYLNTRRRDASLELFRAQRLNLTERLHTWKEIGGIADRYDAIISGSDQVMNFQFLSHGEGKGVITPSYFLPFPFEGKRIGYALSFGCTEYPERMRDLVSGYIRNFDFISVRESTGADIVKSMGRDDAVVVPDPTLLMEPKFYLQIAEGAIGRSAAGRTFCFFIRNVAERKKSVGRVLDGLPAVWNNYDGDFTMAAWLAKIRDAEFVVTDSFHCTVMCLKLHRRFAVVTELKGNVGMNDRFYTLLGRVELEDRIVYKEDTDRIRTLRCQEIDWPQVDNALSDFNETSRVLAANL